MARSASRLAVRPWAGDRRVEVVHADLGGPDVLTYLDLRRIVAEERGLRRRLVIPVPVLTPWLSALWIERLRGALDRLAGGPGLRRGRRGAERLACGDALDCWRVTAVEPERRLALRAEMRVPGEAHLTFDVEPVAGRPDRSRLVQTARFEPRGLGGLACWYALLPVHRVVFARVLQGVCAAAAFRRRRR